MNPVTLLEKPNYPPYVCIYCGLGGPPRKWFIDPGITLDFYFNPANDGNIWICDECWNNLKTQVERCVNQYHLDHDAWDSPDYVTPTYNWKTDKEATDPFNILPVGELPESVENVGSSGDDGTGSDEGGTPTVTTFNFSNAGDDSSSESDDSEPESDVDESAVQSYTAIFGEQPQPE